MFRVDGKMIRSDGPPLKSERRRGFGNRIHVEKRRVVQETGQADFAVAFDKQRFRANVFRAGGEWGAVLRRIPENMPTLQEIITPPVFYSFTRLPRGLVLVGHEKPATASDHPGCDDQPNSSLKPDVHICYPEDPIEFKHPRKGRS